MLAARDLRDYLKGLGMVLDIFPKSEEALFFRDDHDALDDDWKQVGNDLRDACARVRPRLDTPPS